MPAAKRKKRWRASSTDPGPIEAVGEQEAARPTHPGIRRRTLSLRFFGDDTVYTPRSLIRGESSARRIREPSESDAARSVFMKLPEVLSAGDPFRHPDFPKLRPR